MNVMSLKPAVSKIRRIVELRNRGGMESPFFFVVGAGVSYPQVPLASQIEQHCRKEAEYDDTPVPDTSPGMDAYSVWFTRAYPSAEDRQHYLRALMEKQKLSEANLQLAHLVLDGTVARTVFTPNFDDLLTKALELFGQRPLVCDHPLTVSRMRIESKDVQIIHVHGSYWFYDCCNLKDEIRDRSGSLPMSRMLAQSLASHSPLVVGYSGWENDILMTSLKRRLEEGGLGTPVFWFCFRKDALAALPQWLVDHPSVNFVLPDEQAQQAPAGGVAPVLAGAIEIPAVVRSEAPKATAEASDTVKYGELPADRVFREMIFQFRLADPPLISNPLSFFASRLQQSLDTAAFENATTRGSYNFRKVIARVERARTAEPADGPSSLKPFRDAISRVDYRGAIRAAGTIDFSALPSSERREALFMLMDASLGLYDNSPEELQGYELVGRIGELLAQGEELEAGVREQVANALFLKSVTLEALHRNLEALTAYEAFLARFAEATEPVIREQVAKALFSKGALLNALNRNEKAVLVYDELKERFDGATEQVIRENLAKGLFNRGWSLVTLGRNEEAVAAYTDLLDRFVEAPEPVFREQSAKALLNRGVALGALERSEEEIATYDELIHLFGDAPELPLRERVAKGMLNKGATEGTLGRTAEALVTLDELVAKFGDEPDAVFREQIARGIFSKGFMLGTLDRHEEEIVAYDELIERFTDAPEASIRELVAKAVFNKGATLVQLSRNDEALPVYDEVVRRFGGAAEPGIKEQVAKALLSKANLLETAGDTRHASDAYLETIARFDGAEDAGLPEYVYRARTKLEGLQAGTPT